MSFGSRHFVTKTHLMPHDSELFSYLVKMTANSRERNQDRPKTFGCLIEHIVIQDQSWLPKCFQLVDCFADFVQPGVAEG